MSGPRVAVLAVLMAFLSGCSTTTDWDREDGTQFTSFPEGTFRMRARISIQYRDDASGEAARLTFLRDRLATEGLCPNGHEVTERKVGQPLGVLSAWSYVTYSGRCNR
jgi:hypothetical protein